MQISDSLVIKLLSKTDIAKEDIEKLKNHPSIDKKSVQYLAIKEGLITEKELLKLYAAEIDIPFADLKISDIDPSTLGLIPKKVAKEYKAVTFNQTTDTVDVAMEDPEDVKASIYLRKLLGKKLRLFIAEPEKIKKILKSMTEEPPGTIKKESKEEIKKAEITPENISKAVNELVEKAIEIGASDIHIEPRSDFVLTRYRVYGDLRDYHRLPKNMLEPLVNEIKLVAGLSNSEYEMPQSGRFRYESGEKTVSVAVYSMPVIEGEKLVLKIIDDSTKAPDLNELGLWGKSLKDLKHIMSKDKGLIIVSGPVGSGRTTTLFSILTKLYSPTLSIATIEDPVEHRIAGVNQTAVNNNLGISFATGLRAILDHDPNIIMVGELRDVETAELIMQAAHKGHLVLTSMFTSGTLSTLKMLSSMGVEPHITAAVLNGIVTQRLVRRLCASCMVSVSPSSTVSRQIKDMFGLSGDGLKYVHTLEKSAISEELGPDKAKGQSSSLTIINRLWQPSEEGCKYCDYSGYKGRIGLFEILSPDEKVVNAVAGDKGDAEIKKAISGSGLIAIKIDGLVKALRGLTTVDEVLRVTADA